MTVDQDFDNEHGRKLFSHPVYEHYDKLHTAHLEGNPKSALIKENLLSALTGEVLYGENKINLRSKSLFVIDDKFLSVFDDVSKLLDHEKNFSYTFFHLGSDLSGHPTIVHGGLMATLLDELACRLGFQNYKSRKAVTANLNVSYYKPCRTNSYIMVKCTLSKKEGRKCWIKGEVFNLDLDGDLDADVVERKENLLSACECLIVEPTWSLDQ